MSMVVEAQIDTNVETVIVDPQIKAMSTSKPASEAESSPCTQTTPRYPIPCHSSSNVVVEPSGLLELNNFTSQRLDDEETAVEQDVDSSTEDGTEPSPSQSSAEQS
ncbi:UNVERIFIED_CONTAM: hypothetical protein H355_013598 [Colinus virginianus]|nr:hypothetical protein H355_013598 [Colinus virginianus]